MSEKLVILKLGGSVITFKDRLMNPNLNSISRLAEEISKAGVDNLIVVHGGGSFGHPLASKYELHKGFKDNIQLEGLSRVHLAMRELNRIVISSLLDHGVKAVGVQPSSCALTRSGKIEVFEYRPIRDILRFGMTPVTYGDVVFDIDRGFSILSGDQITSYLAIHLKSERIIVGTDVDGLYTENPKHNPEAKLIESITLDELKRMTNFIGESSVTDVTRGMYGKIVELTPAVERGVKVLIVNANERNRVLKALRNEKVYGTLILRS